VAPDGTPSVRRDAAGRLVGEIDRHGAPLSELDWAPDGGLRRAAVRIPDGSWVTVAPRAGAPGPWGLSDALRHDDRALSTFAALDWSRIDRVPPLAEPARLPPGAGTAVLNLIAQLADEQGARRLRYDGPYPTEQLFLALLESFRWIGDGIVDPLAAFMGGGALEWTAAPHARSFEADGVYVQRRERIEKIVTRGRAFHRADWQGIGRRTPRVVRDAGDTVRASLQFLGVVVEDQVVLDPAGTVLDLPRPPADALASRPLPDALVMGLVATVVAGSAPPLAAFIRGAAEELAFAWTPVAGDLVEITAADVRLSPRLLRVLRAVLTRSSSRVERVGVALAALGEAAELVGDALRQRAQRTLAAADAETQAEALAGTSVSDGHDAAAIGAAIEALMQAADQVA
jgi:hypothetical protein